MMIILTVFDCGVCGGERQAEVQHCENPACTQNGPCERLECLTCGTSYPV